MIGPVHARLVDVGCAPVVMVVDPWLPLWVVSVDEGTYTAVMVTVPDDLGVNVTVQVPAARLQFAVVLVTEAPEAVKSTVPRGVVADPGDVSDTVAVQVDVWFTLTGVQLTFVSVVLRVTLTVAAGLVLDECVESGVYAAMIVEVSDEDPVKLKVQLPLDSRQF